MAAVQNIVIQITYQNIRSSSNPHHSSNPAKPNPRPSIRTIQPIALYAMKGYWYCQAYDLDKQAYRVFRCDRITSPQMTDIEPMTHINELNLQDTHSLWKPSVEAILFKCLINEDGIELFQQEQFPSMQLINESGADSGRIGYTYLVGSYEAHELEFIIRYLASFGKSIKIMEPATLKESLRQHYLDLLDHV